MIKTAFVGNIRRKLLPLHPKLGLFYYYKNTTFIEAKITSFHQYSMRGSSNKTKIAFLLILDGSLYSLCL